MRISGRDGGRPISVNARSDAISIALADASTTQWEIFVEAHTPDGPARVGTLLTAAPSAGSGATRFVGFASAVGAVSWLISARVSVGAPDAVADLWIAPASSAPGFVGCVANGSFAAVVP